MVSLFSNTLQRFILVFFLIAATLSFGKSVTLRWEKVSTARGYEIEVLQNSKAIESTKVGNEKQFWKKEFPPGIYFYHVRALDKDGEPGQWTETQHFIIPPEIPKLTAIENGATYEQSSTTPLKLSWESVTGADSYLIKLKEPKKGTIEKLSKDPNLTLNVSVLGSYEWTVQAKLKPEAAIKSQELLGKPSEAWTFEVIEKRLPAPTGLSPSGLIGEAGEKVHFSWNPVEKAGAYEIEITPVGDRSPASQPIKKRIEKNEIEMEVPMKGAFTWKVRSLSSIDSKTVEAESTSAETIKRISPVANYSLQLAAYGGFASSEISMNSTATTFSGRAKTIGNQFGLTLQYNYAQWGVRLLAQDQVVTFDSNRSHILNAFLTVERRFNLTSQASLIPKIGISKLDYLQVNVFSTSTRVSQHTLESFGPGAELEFDYLWTPRFGTGLIASLQVPVKIGGSESRKLSIKESLPNYIAGVKAHYLLFSNVELQAFLGYEERNCKYFMDTAYEQIKSRDTFARLGLGFYFGE